MDLNYNIMRFRKERGLTQEQLANLLNVSVSAVSKWELGNNCPNLELLPSLAEIFQVSIDSLLGYEKSYKNIDKELVKINSLLGQAKYITAIEEAFAVLKRYPNDIRINKIIADAYYSLCFSTNTPDGKKENAEKAIYYYEKSIELFDEKQVSEYTKEDLYVNIATLYALDEIEMYDEAVSILEKYNGSRKYDNLIGSYLFSTGRKEEAKNRLLLHCICQQIFVFNDLSMLANMYIEDGEYEKALLFLETQIKSFELFMNDEGGYANRAYAGSAYKISEIYTKTGGHEKAAEWYEKAKKHASIYAKNPSMLISSIKYCHGLDGRMIDSYGEVLDRLNE